ncbi:hypothetical protein [Enterococcus mediterraneensis]|uniref:hypothetical protein n=1 Tax=Enterococcus mediterraneensis TaxID=2364791 RepID=UPI000F06921A|nr:hypothetical protein [Enterococcus mediterraneensis]
MKVSEIENVIQFVTKKIYESQIRTKKYIIAHNAPFKNYPCKMIYELDDVEWVDANQTTNAQGLIVDSLSLKQAVSIANLMPQDQLCIQILDFLFKGKPVWVVGDAGTYEKLLQKNKYRLREKIQDIQKQCQGYGIVFFDKEQSFVDILRDIPKETKTKSMIVPSFITEKKLIQLFEHGNIVLPVNSRLTPLAKDFAKEHDIEI